MPPAQYIDIVNVIANRLSAVTNIGRVHTYQRNIISLDIIKQEFLDNALGRINAWTISREAMPTEQLTNIENTIAHQFVLRGYMAVEDAKATELIFQQVINDVYSAFCPQDDLSDVVEYIEPVSASGIGYAQLGGESGILCHSAEVRIMAHELISN